MYSDCHKGERPGVMGDKKCRPVVGKQLLPKRTGSKYFRLYEPISKME